MGSSTSSSSSSSTQNIDKRLVTGEGSVGISADNSKVSVQVMDGGAIAGALDLARQTDANAGKNLEQLLGFGRDLFVGSLEALDKAQQSIKDSSAIVAKAYDQAKGHGDEARILSYGVMAVVALVAVKSLGR